MHNTQEKTKGRVCYFQIPSMSYPSEQVEEGVLEVVATSSTTVTESWKWVLRVVLVVIFMAALWHRRGSILRCRNDWDENFPENLESEEDEHQEFGKSKSSEVKGQISPP